MANRAGLKKVTKIVHGKKGNVKRSYWIKAKEDAKEGWRRGQAAGHALGRAVSGFVKRHKGKIAAGVGLAAAGYGAYKGHQLFKAGSALGMTRGATLKAAASGLKERAKGAAERGAHAVVGVGAKAHKAVSTRMEQRAHRKAASSAEMPKRGVGGTIRAAARSVASKVKERVGRRKQKGAGALPSGS